MTTFGCLLYRLLLLNRNVLFFTNRLRDVRFFIIAAFAELEFLLGVADGFVQDDFAESRGATGPM